MHGIYLNYRDNLWLHCTRPFCLHRRRMCIGNVILCTEMRCIRVPFHRYRLYNRQYRCIVRQFQYIHRSCIATKESHHNQILDLQQNKKKKTKHNNIIKNINYHVFIKWNWALNVVLGGWFKLNRQPTADNSLTLNAEPLESSPKKKKINTNK